MIDLKKTHTPLTKAGLYPVTIRHIQQTVADAYGCPLHLMLSSRRHRRYARPRQLAMYLAHEMTTLSLPRIGKAFDRDHTTVLHAVRVIERKIAEMPERQITITKLWQQIAGEA